MVNYDGKLEYLKYERRGTLFDFEYESEGDETLMVPLIYYKGYSAYYYEGVNKINIPLVWTETYKQVAFNTIKGKHRYIVHYDGTLIQKVSLGISFVTLIGVIVIIIRKRKYSL